MKRLVHGIFRHPRALSDMNETDASCRPYGLERITALQSR